MKKIFLLSALVLGSITATSQISSGAKFGATFSNLSTVNFSNTSLAENAVSALEGGRRGYFAGFFVGIPISEKLNFQPELMYVQQGSNADVLRIDYLQLPLAINYDFGESIFVNFGPQIGMRIWTPGDSSLIDSFDYSVFGSLGFNVTDMFFIEARYSFGLNDIATGRTIPLDVNNEVLTNPSLKNSFLNIGVGFKI